MDNKSKRDAISKKLDSMDYLGDIDGLLDSSLTVKMPSDIDNTSRQVHGTFDVHKQRKSDSTNIAKKTLESLFEFYISNNIISNNTYLRCKMELDIITLETLVNQIKINEYAIERLVDLIDSGEANSKVFDSLSSLQKTYIDLIKAKTMFILASEEHAKKLRNDTESYGTISIDDDAPKLKKKNDDNVHRGTRDFLKGIQDDIDSQ